MNELTGPGGPFQQLGAAPGTPGANGVLGYEGNEPEGLLREQSFDKA